MNVLILTGELGLTDEALYALTLARSLVDRGHQVRLIGCDGPLGSPLLRGAPPVEHHHLTGTPWRDRFEHRRLKRRLRESAPDLLHVTSPEWDATARLLARALDIPRVTSDHTGRGLVETVRTPPDVLIVPPEAVDPGHDCVFRVPKGLELPPTVRTDKPSRPMRSVGTIGPLLRERQLKTFLRALIVVAEAHPDLLFPVVGSGPYHRFLVRRAREFGLYDRLVICDPSAEPHGILSGLDLVVFPGVGCESEYLPLLSIGSGRPTLISLASPAVAYFEELVPEWVIPGDSPEAMARCMLAVIAKPAASRRKAAKAQRAVKTIFDTAPMIEGVEAAYLAALGALPDGSIAF